MHTTVVTIALLLFARCASAADADSVYLAVLDSSAADSMALDAAWLQSVWTHVDSLVTKEDFALQKIVTAAGSRGAEAEEDLLAELPYQSKQSPPKRSDIEKAIVILSERLRKDPQGGDIPHLLFYIAQCQERLGHANKAAALYKEIVAKHGQTTWAERAKKELTSLQ